MTPSHFKSIIEQAGAEFKGIRGKGEFVLVYFNDPSTDSTLALRVSHFNLEAVKQKMENSRKEFKAKEALK